MAFELYGYQFSVYSWIARLALEEKGVDYHWIEVDPFAQSVPVSYLALHPFKRVPTLVHDSFQLYETGAITRYIDEAFPGPSLQPTDARHRARCSQFISIVDSYAYWPLVRQVFSHCVFRARFRRPSDETEIRKGLEAAPYYIEYVRSFHTGLHLGAARGALPAHHAAGEHAAGVATKPMFRDALKKRRCIVPMTGFYEWRQLADGKQPFFISAIDGSYSPAPGCGTHGTIVRKVSGFARQR